MHGVTKPVTMTVEWRGEVTDPWGNKKAALSGKIEKLNRKDFGLNWNKALETGGVVVGEEVAINLEVEGGLKADLAEKPADTAKKDSKPLKK
jgi:polyisoprenoid-binding protein YceI